jgi:hypothetical protein
MANNFGRVNVSVTASTGGLTAGLSRAGKSLNRFANTVTAIANPLSMLGGIARSTFGQLAMFSMARGAIHSLTGMASSAAENVDVLSKLSRRLGTTYSELAGLKLAGDLAGVGIEEIAKAMTKADVAMVKAQSGSKEAAQAFASLGLSASRLSKLSGAARFEAIATAISRIPGEANRSAAAVALFGKSGAELLPLFEDGAGSIQKAREEAQRFGLALTDMQGRRVEEMNDSFTRVKVAIEGIVQQMTALLAPAIENIAKRFSNFVGSVGGQNIGQAIGRGIIDGAKYLALIADQVINRFRELYFGIADSLGIQTSKEAKRLAEMQAQINAGMAPEAMVPGGGGFLSVTDPVFLREFNELKKVVADQRKPLTTFADLTREASAAISSNIDVYEQQRLDSYGNLTRNSMTQMAPITAEFRRFHDTLRNATVRAGLENVNPRVAQPVKLSSEDLRAIVAGSAEAENFINSLRRGADPRLETREESRRTADATERTAAATEQIARTGLIGLATIA